MASNLCSEHMPEGQYHGQASLLLASQLFHFPQCHKGLVSSRNENMCLCHSVRYSCTSETKLREFHYMISRKTLTTDEKFYQWGMIENDTCTSCHNSPETSLHLFFECETSRGPWNDNATGRQDHVILK